MRKTLIGLAATAILSAPALGREAPPALSALTPNSVIAAAPSTEWRQIAASDLLVMDLGPDREGRARRVVIQLLPAPLSQGWIDNIRKLVAARWFDGIAVVRVQDNYVVQWGDPDGETPGKAEPLPPGLRTVPQSEYTTPLKAEWMPASHSQPGLKRDPYIRSGTTMMRQGWPLGTDGKLVWPLHCYGMVGVGRNNAPDTGSGAELYAVIGQAPRQLDRNIALVGRVIAGIEHISSLPRGTGEIGFYKTAAERTPIQSVRMGDTVQGLSRYEYLSTESASFAAYLDKRANRKDAFYIAPAGGVDVCNVPVPIREVRP